MKNETKAKNPFVKLDEKVTPASSTERSVKTNQAGAVLGLGCNHCQVLLAV